MPKKTPSKPRPKRSREERRAHLRGALSKLVELAEAAAELHVAASMTASAIADLLEEFEDVRR